MKIVPALLTVACLVSPGPKTKAEDPQDIPIAKVGLRLLDESGNPLVDHPCGIGLHTYSKEWKLLFVPRDGKTDVKGEFWAEGRALPNMGCGLGFDLKGYYKSSRLVDFQGIEDGKLVPFGVAYDVVAKRVVNPRPMYAAAFWRILLPAATGTFGFDLQRADWTAPHGAGATADLIFSQDVKDGGVLGSTAALTISFSNPGDGLIPLYELEGAESELKLPRTAPAEGYERARTLTAEWSPNQGFKRPVRPALGYVYRVRTILDETGHVKHAWYGKINGEFNWEPQREPNGTVKFSYYLNPDGTPNLEFDRGQNLLRGVRYEHVVRLP
jgi:hypothetical protein